MESEPACKKQLSLRKAMIMQCRIRRTVKGFRIGTINVATLNEL